MTQESQSASMLAIMPSNSRMIARYFIERGKVIWLSTVFALI